MATTDAIVVGAGFAGLYMLHLLRVQGLTVQGLEGADGVGGTWYSNRYPGARCDVESLQYAYSFSEELSREWEWTERYAAQPEILRYIEHVADRFGLRDAISFGSRVTEAAYDSTTRLWAVTTSRGEILRARFLITAVGCLSAGNVPAVPGLESFQGRWFHSGDWPHEGVDLNGTSVAVVGTGSSGIQMIPVIAEQAGQLRVFQRTPGFSVPAVNGSLDAEARRMFGENRPAIIERVRKSTGGYLIDSVQRWGSRTPVAERMAEYERAWARGGIGFLATFMDHFLLEEINETAADFIRNKIRDIISDPETAERLIPYGYPLGTKRMCTDTGYYETYNRPNVFLVDVREEPIQEIVPQGIRTSRTTYTVDTLVFATGFDAFTGPLLAMNVTGRDGLSLRDKWAAGPISYLGLMSAGFPNLFTITGPGSPSVLSNMLVSIEQHVEWIARCIDDLQRDLGDSAVIEPDPESETAWSEHVSNLAESTLYGTVDSWYAGANIPGKPRRFLPYVAGVGTYRGICAQIAAEGYKGFIRTA